MSRRFHTGLEWGSVTDGNVLTSGAVGTIDATSARSGAFGHHITLSAATRTGLAKPFESANAARHWFTRFYLYIVAAPNVNSSVFQIGSGADASGHAMSVRLNTDRTLALVDEDGDIGSSSALSLDTWFRIEVEFDNTPASGSHVGRLRIDGTNVVEATNRAVATLPRGVAWGGNVYTSASASSGEWYIDDVAVNDTSNSHQTSWPGSGKILALLPNADGTTTNRGTQGTDWDTGPTTGQTALAQVDEAMPPDDDTSYLTLLATSAGTTDPPVMLFNVESATGKGVASGDTIKLVAVRLRHGSTTGSGRRHHHVLKSGGSYVDGAQIVTGTSTYEWDADDGNAPPEWTRIVQYTDPATSAAWTLTALDAVEVGFRAGSDVNPVPRMSFVAAEIEYDPVAVTPKSKPFTLGMHSPRFLQRKRVA